MEMLAIGTWKTRFPIAQIFPGESLSPRPYPEYGGRSDLNHPEGRIMKLVSLLFVLLTPCMAQNITGHGEIHTFLPADLSENDRFGDRAVEIKGTTVAIGAYGHDAFGVDDNAGALYIFEPDLSGAWTQIQKIIPEGLPVNEIYGVAFGTDVSIEGDIMEATLIPEGLS